MQASVAETKPERSYNINLKGVLAKAGTPFFLPVSDPEKKPKKKYERKKPPKVQVTCRTCPSTFEAQPRTLAKYPEGMQCRSCVNRSRSPDVLARIGKGVKKVLSTAEGKAKHAAGIEKKKSKGWKPRMPVVSKEVRQKATEKLWEDPEYRAKQEAAAVWKKDSRAGERMRLANLAAWDEAKKSEHSECMKEKWKDPAFIALQQSYRTEEWKESRSRLMKRAWQNPKFRARWSEIARSESNLAHLQRLRDTMPKVSVLSEVVAAALKDLGVEFELEYPLGPFHFDVFIPSRSLLLELNGEYWHSLPLAIRTDKSKVTFVDHFHPELKLRYIWEVEFYKKGRLRHILENLLGLSAPTLQHQFDFPDLHIAETPYREAAVFYGAHHYLPSARTGRHLGLYIMREKLIGCCTFSAFQRKQQADKYKGFVELSRFCLHPEFQKPNLGSWFLSRCLKLCGKGVVTYADFAQGHTGALYKACNFMFSHEVPPDYVWVDSAGWGLNKRTVWGRASKMSMTEKEYAERHSLQKKWGAPKFCFMYAP